MPALVRRGTFWQRLKSRLDLPELALYIAEELNDDKYYDLLNWVAIPLAVSLNILFALLRNSYQPVDDDVFHEPRGGHIYAVLHAVLLYGLTAITCLNAIYAFFRKKQYQLLYQSIDETPASPNARRVTIDIGNGKEEVWEVDVWQPTDLSMTLFTYFSPVHVVLYYAILPTSRTHALLVAVLGLAMSVQFAVVQRLYTRQGQDTRLIHGQVMNEYDLKFVQPLMHRSVRDVGVQAGTQGRWTVDAYSPGIQLNRGTGHLNYTPTSRSSDHGTNTPRSSANGYTPTQGGQASALSLLKQRQGRRHTDNVTPPVRFSNSYNQSPLNGVTSRDESGDEIRVAWKPSPPSQEDRRKSYRT